MWKLCRTLSSYHACNSSWQRIVLILQKGKLSPQETCQDTEWVGLLLLKPGPTEAPAPLAHLTFLIRIYRPGWMLSQFTGFPHICHPSQAKSRGEWKREVGEPPESSLFSLTPWDLNVKEMGHKHSSKSCTVLFSSFDTSFGCICLFSWKCICAHELRIKVHRNLF